MQKRKVVNVGAHEISVRPWRYWVYMSLLETIYLAETKVGSEYHTKYHAIKLLPYEKYPRFEDGKQTGIKRDFD